MALTNFIITAVVVGAAYVMLRGDVSKSSVTLRRNLKQVRHWMEQEEATSAALKDVKAKEIDPKFLENKPQQPQSQSQPQPQPQQRQEQQQQQ